MANAADPPRRPAGGLKARLVERIALEGPMSIPDYMAACLHDPLDGYYATRPAIGVEGDFITAPMVSQMFGELIGAWTAEVWMRLGRPSPFSLVEIGPGDGTLMADALRALGRVPGLADACRLRLVEPSRPLRLLQAARLEGHEVQWAKGLGDLPTDAPMILVANEVLDCLAAAQFVRTGHGWAERRIGLGRDGELAFGLAPADVGVGPLPEDVSVPDGTLVEVAAQQSMFAMQLATRVRDHGGTALLIDYGRDRPGPGDTLQALHRHTKVDPLADPGGADLTMHADFPAATAAARDVGAEVSGPITQARFLTALGVELRADALARARPDKAATIRRQLARLIDPDQMGTLFKVLAIHQKGLAVPGFEDAAPEEPA